MNPERLLDRADTPGHLNILSVFLTVDGEANCWHPGTWSTFVRLTGCRVGCHWCDTKYSWGIKQGQLVTAEQLVVMVHEASRGCKKVTITGGEPLEQDGPVLRSFLQILGHEGFDITMETAGTESVQGVLTYGNEDLKLVVDYKLPGSRSAKGPNVDAFRGLDQTHVVKFVIDSKDDFYKAIQSVILLRNGWQCDARMVFSPSFHNVQAKELFAWMKDSSCPSLRIGMNMQMHKYIFPELSREEEGGGQNFERAKA